MKVAGILSSRFPSSNLRALIPSFINIRNDKSMLCQVSKENYPEGGVAEHAVKIAGALPYRVLRARHMPGDGICHKYKFLSRNR